MRARVTIPILACVLLAGCQGKASDPQPAPSASVDIAAYNSFADGLWQLVSGHHAGVERPSTTLVRVVPDLEWPTVDAQCLRDAGFNATVTDDGGVQTSGFPDDQRLAFDLANYRCAVEYPSQSNIDSAKPEYAHSVYRYYVDQLIPCLEQAGYQITDVPSEQSFVDSWEAEPWTPTDQLNDGLDDAGKGELFQVLSNCPQAP